MTVENSKEIEEVSSDESDDDMAQLCEMLKRTIRGNRFEDKRRSAKKPDGNGVAKNLRETVDANKVVGTAATICFQCREFGHTHQDCRRPKTHLFCFLCGRPGTTSDKCTTNGCVQRRQSKNE